jgi:hypothetical protein
VVALKVPRSTKSKFCKEYRTLVAAWNDGAPVVQLLAKVESPLCAAYTMTPVGRTLPKAMDTGRLLFAALKQLPTAVDGFTAMHDIPMLSRLQKRRFFG